MTDWNRAADVFEGAATAAHRSWVGCSGGFEPCPEKECREARDFIAALRAGGPVVSVPGAAEMLARLGRLTHHSAVHDGQWSVCSFIACQDERDMVARLRAAESAPAQAPDAVTRALEGLLAEVANYSKYAQPSDASFERLAGLRAVARTAIDGAAPARTTSPSSLCRPCAADAHEDCDDPTCQCPCPSRGPHHRVAQPSLPIEQPWQTAQKRFETARDLLLAVASRRDLLAHDVTAAIETADDLLAELAKVKP